MILFVFVFLFFCKQKTAYEMRISDWSSDVCSSDLHQFRFSPRVHEGLCAKNYHMPRIKPSILKWARESAGLSLEEAAPKVGINDARGQSGAERLLALETAEGDVSRPVLLKMAKERKSDVKGRSVSVRVDSRGG